jgi:alpha-glucosidase
MRTVVDAFEDRVLIGEIYLPIERLVAYYGRDLSGVHLPFNFTLLNAPWHARQIATLIDEYEAALPLGGWPNWVLGNHDRPRIASRVGLQQARAAAMLLLTLRGTPTIYYGDEIGMEQVALRPEDIRDPFEMNVPGKGVGRDGCRTPMAWDAASHAGFSEVRPWLPLADNWPTENVAAQRSQAGSIHNFYRELIALRRACPALQFGSYRPLAATGDLLLYMREHETTRILVALNLGSEPTAASFAGERLSGRVLISSHGGRKGEQIEHDLVLRADEAILVELGG